MEGLIPLVFRAMKKNKTRRQYHCLSTGSSLSYINMAEICPQTESQSHVFNQTASTQKVSHHHNHLYAGDEHDHRHHRRHTSVGDIDHRFSSAHGNRTDSGSLTPKQLVRFGSRGMFSCINGV